eukprot:COSAG02_NODE_243_length_27457_cov_16.852328_3_plen_103_part_00
MAAPRAHYVYKFTRDRSRARIGRDEPAMRLHSAHIVRIDSGLNLGTAAADPKTRRMNGGVRLQQLYTVLKSQTYTGNKYDSRVEVRARLNTRVHRGPRARER